MYILSKNTYLTEIFAYVYLSPVTTLYQQFLKRLVVWSYAFERNQACSNPVRALTNCIEGRKILRKQI